MSARRRWTRQELLVAFNLYCQIPFGKFHNGNPEIIKFAGLIGRTLSALAMKLCNIASLDPVITSTGRVALQGASLADRNMWDEMQSDWENFVEECVQAVQSLLNDTESLDETGQQEKSENQDFSGKYRTVTSKARVGQDFFRKAVLSAYDSKCCITGLSVPRLLVASHIVPWRDDEHNRLNPRNGLLLSMLHDKAFDSGMIAIDEDMSIRVSRTEAVSKDPFFESSILAFEGKKIQLPDKFQPDLDFLAYHRENIFEK